MNPSPTRGPEGPGSERPRFDWRELERRGAQRREPERRGPETSRPAQAQPKAPDAGDAFASGATLGVFDELKIADRMPTSPGLCLAILGLTGEERDSTADLVDSIRVDPALTGRLLSLVNSSRGSRIAPAATVRGAAALLDPIAIRNVALTFNLLSRSPDETCAAFDYRRHWLRSLACAAACEALARRFGTWDLEEAFTLGLLCRIGMLAMATLHPEEFAQVLRECEGRSEEHLAAAEIRALRLDHWQVAVHLMTDWGLPQAFLESVSSLSKDAQGGGSGESLPLSGHSLLSLGLRLADEIVDARGAKGTQASADERRSDRSNEPSSSGSSEVSKARDEARHRWIELAERCGLEPLPRPRREDDRKTRGSGEDQGSQGADTPGVGSTTEARPVFAHPATRVLVVDDDPSARHLLCVHLRRAGFEVLSASDRQAGLATALSEGPQMVITDWLMPGMSGLELCRALRRVEAGRKIYILLLTSREEEDSVVEGLEAGANDYVTKPFNPRILLARVHSGERVIDLQRQVEVDKLIDRKRVAQMAQLTRKLRSVALVDALTGLANRRHAMSQLKDAWTAAERHGRPLSVVMIDLDHFKRINDRYGHQTGDAVLTSTAEVLRAKCRRSDVVCRLGGEEFLVISVHCGLADALVCAERLRAAVEANRITVPGFEGGITASLGVAERTAEMRSLDDLIAAGDRAVYAAKSLGRNQVRPSDPPGPISSQRAG